MSDSETVDPVGQVDPSDLVATDTMPDRGKYDTEVTNFNTDVQTVDGQGERINTAVTNFNEADRGFWETIGGWFSDLISNIDEALRDFFESVGEFFTLVGTFDQGMPYDIYEAGEAFLDAQRIFSGQIVNISAWNLPAANGTWTGENANTYRAGILAQAAALTKLQTWCGDAGGVLMRHARNVVGAYLDMRLLLAAQVKTIHDNISDLIVTDPSKFLSIVGTICKLAVNLVMVMVNVTTAFDKWANESLKSIDTMKIAMANQSGTDSGTWPTFVSA